MKRHHKLSNLINYSNINFVVFCESLVITARNRYFWKHYNFEWSISEVEEAGQVYGRPIQSQYHVTLGFIFGNLYDVSYDYRLLGNYNYCFIDEINYHLLIVFQNRLQNKVIHTIISRADVCATGCVD